MIFLHPSKTAEQRVREFLLEAPSASETVESLASKLRINRWSCRRVLESLVNEGVVRRRDFTDIAPIYYRYPAR